MKLTKAQRKALSRLLSVVSITYPESLKLRALEKRGFVVTNQHQCTSITDAGRRALEDSKVKDIERAILIATNLHRGQVDKSGNAYICILSASCSDFLMT